MFTFCNREKHIFWDWQWCISWAPFTLCFSCQLKYLNVFTLTQCYFICNLANHSYLHWWNYSEKLSAITQGKCSISSSGSALFLWCVYSFFPKDLTENLLYHLIQLWGLKLKSFGLYSVVSDLPALIHWKKKSKIKKSIVHVSAVLADVNHESISYEWSMN